METPKKICLIDTGDGVVWCDSVPSDDIEDSDVVWYTRTPSSSADKLIAALEHIMRVNGHISHDIAKQALAAYQKEQEL